MPESFQRELRAYLAAGYAALYVLSPEEERAEGEIQSAAEALGRGMWVWELGEGWTVKTGKSRTVEAKDPLTAIKVAVDAAPAGTVLVLRDYHPFVKVPENQRKIKSALSKFSAGRKTFIFLSPVQVIPPELEKGITPIEMTLPSREELGLILDDIAEGVKEKINSTIRSDLLDAAAGLTTREAEDAFARARVMAQTFNQEAVAVVQKQKSAIVKKSGLLEMWDRVESPENLGGLKALKKYFARSRMAFTPEAKEFGLLKLSGTLLIGPPGTGKSLAAKVAASIFQWPLFRLDLGRIFGSLVGMSEMNARYSCSLMEAVAPAVCWIDEAEKGFAGTKSSGHTDSGVTARVLSTYLTWMQETQASLYFVATCNSIESMPPELLRRFDDVFFVDLPDDEAKQEILAIHLKKRKQNPEKFDLSEVSCAMDGYSGDDIERAIQQAMLQALEEKRKLKTSDILDAASERVPTLKIKSDEISNMREWAAKQGVRMASVGSRVREETKSSKRRRIDGGPSLN